MLQLVKESGGPKFGADFHPVAMKQRNISQIFAVLQKPVVYPLTLCIPPSSFYTCPLCNGCDLHADGRGRRCFVIQNPGS